ncbi:synaptotagmin-1-like isoform X2 [Copidosoma floridanum]|uniref:synaptotagmin-1-like isoform X2 n=1 Tax=Copidosoma floridanum TaxID=29053 RepID=UPI000C6F994C|nr:synaptotagmin-1-like isoform X2 [Copidosoma floridanum]
MSYEEAIGPLGVIIICSVAAIIFGIALLIAVCFCIPKCIGYKWIKRKKKPLSSKENGKFNEDPKLSEMSYRSWRLNSLYSNGDDTIHEDTVYSPDLSPPLNSNNLHFNTIDTSSVLNLVPKKKDDVGEKIFPTELTLSLRYFPYCEGITASKLVIGIEALSGLPPKQYNSSIEPYVRLEVIKKSWSHRKRQKLYSFQTKVVKHTASPIFKESFVISSGIPHEMKDWILNIEAYDRDRYANHSKLCELQVRMKDMQRILFSPEIHLFNFHMKQCKQEYGNILLGVSYLPTAQRLSINVMKLRNIKFMPDVPSLNEFNPYIRIIMLNGMTGKKIKREKTKYLKSTAEPEFNETLTFDLPTSQMDTLQFLIVLCSKVRFNIVTMMNEILSDDDDSVISYRRPKDVCIGKVALGKGVRGVNERLHWFSVFQNPRKLVTSWHTLR